MRNTSATAPAGPARTSVTGMADTVVDCHLQVWNPQTVHYPWMAAGLARTDRPWSLDDVRDDLAEQGVHRVVLVQSADNRADSELMLFQALTSPVVAGVVAWVPMARPDEAASQLHAWRHEPVVGVGHRVHEEEPDWLLRPEVDESLGLLAERSLTFDVTAWTPALLGHVVTLAEQHPKVAFVVSRLGRPPLAARACGETGAWSQWQAWLATLAQLPNVALKLTGLGADLAPGWTRADVQPAVDTALETVGADRVMLGSDWPTVQVAGGTYAHAWSELRATLEPLDARERTLVLGGTANRVYALPLD